MNGMLIPRVAQERFYYLTSNFFRYAFLTFIAGLILSPFVGIMWYTHTLAKEELKGLEQRLVEEKKLTQDVVKKTGPLLEQKNFLQQISQNQRMPVYPILHEISNTIPNDIGIRGLIFKISNADSSREGVLSINLFSNSELNQKEIEQWGEELKNKVSTHKINLIDWQTGTVEKVGDGFNFSISAKLEIDKTNEQ